MKKNIIYFLLSTLVSGYAHSAFRSEVFVGGSTGGQLAYRKSAVNYTMSNSGVPVGIFLGYRSSKGFFSGLEYTFIGLGFTDAKSPATHVDITTSQHYGALKFGYEGSRIRFSLSYVPINNLYFYRRASTQTNTPDLFTGSAAGASIGVNMGTRWALDLGFYNETFTTFDFGSSKGQTITGSSTFNNVTNTNVLLNLVFKLSGLK